MPAGRRRPDDRGPQEPDPPEWSLRSLLDRLPGMAYRCANAPGWAMEVVSHGALELTGHPREDFLERRVRYDDLIHPEDRDEVWARVQEAVERQSKYRLEYRIRTRAGDLRHVREEGEGVCDASGNPVALEGFILDQTERYERERELARGEERLAASEYHYRKLFQSNPFPAWAFDPESLAIVDANLAAVERYGYTREEFLQMTVRDLPHPEYAPVALEGKEHAGDDGRFAAHGRTRHRTKSGETLDVEVYSHEVRFRDQVTRIVMVHDVTEQHQYEEALRGSEQRFRALIENSLDLISVVSPDGTILYESPSLERMLGHRPQDLVGQSIFPFIHPDDIAEVAATMERVLAEADQPHSVVLRFRHADGTWRHLDVHARSRVEVPGVEGIVVHSRDISERVRVEEELRFQRAILTAQSELSPDGILVVTSDQEILSYDQQFLRMWDIPEELIEQGRRNEILERVLGAVVDPVGFLARMEYLGVHPGEHAHEYIALVDGRTFERFTAPFNIDGDVVGRIWFHRDVTEQVAAQDSMRMAKEEAERANRAKSEFLSRMSHELRTPMNAVLGFSQVLEMDLQTERDLESVQQILRAGRHLLDLIDEVLDLSRIEAEKITLSLEPVRVHDAVAECLELVRPMATEREIEVRVTHCDAYVEADLQRLKQVLLNLLANAIKYNRSGGRVEVICGPEQDGRVVVEVRDTGAGLSPEQLSRIFTPFERLGAESTGVQGTGLGLSVSQRLVGVMGGRLTVDSQPGDGSTFRVELPSAVPPGGAEAAEGMEWQDGPTASVPQLRVLYIEDDLSNLQLVQRVFARRSDLRLIPTMEGRTGLQLAADEPPDLILLDVHLPDMRGDEVLRELKADVRLRDIPVVVVSADATPSQIDRLMAAGAHDYLAKPLNLATFLTSIDTALGLRPREREADLGE